MSAFRRTSGLIESFAVAAFVLGAVALVACLLPTWRAARVDPLVALRTE